MDACYNLGFELSDFSNWVRWEGFTGNQGTVVPNTFYTTSNSNGSSNIVNNASVFSNDYFVINTTIPSDSITGVGYDFYAFNGTQYTFKPLQSSGGNYSARLNNAQSGFKCKKAEYTFKVTDAALIPIGFEPMFHFSNLQ